MDNPVTIYHNPRCSKSRETLSLLQEHGEQPRVVKYLEEPPDEATLRRLLDLLGLEPIDLIRTKEKLYKELGLDQQRENPQALIQAMVQHPILIERPIVVRGRQARLGRPPEKVLEILSTHGRGVG